MKIVKIGLSGQTPEVKIPSKSKILGVDFGSGVNKKLSLIVLANDEEKSEESLKFKIFKTEDTISEEEFRTLSHLNSRGDLHVFRVIEVEKANE